MVTPPCAASLAGATDMRRGAAAGSVGVAACGIEKTAAARQPVSQCRDSACQTARSRGNHLPCTLRSTFKVLQKRKTVPRTSRPPHFDECPSETLQEGHREGSNHKATESQGTCEDHAGPTEHTPDRHQVDECGAAGSGNAKEPQNVLRGSSRVFCGVRFSLPDQRQVVEPQGSTSEPCYPHVLVARDGTIPLPMASPYSFLRSGTASNAGLPSGDQLLASFLESNRRRLGRSAPARGVLVPRIDTAREHWCTRPVPTRHHQRHMEQLADSSLTPIRR